MKDTTTVVSPIFTFTIQVEGFTAGSVISDFCKKNQLHFTLVTTEHAPVRTSNVTSIKSGRKKRKTHVAITAPVRTKIRHLKKVNPNWSYEKIAAYAGVSPSSVWRVLTASNNKNSK